MKAATGPHQDSSYILHLQLFNYYISANIFRFLVSVGRNQHFLNKKLLSHFIFCSPRSIMALTPLYMHALQLNQKITDSVYQYRSITYWDSNTGQFEREGRQGHIYSWLFANGIIAGIIIPGLVLCLLQTIFDPASLSIQHNLSAVFILCLGIGVICTSVALYVHASDIILFCKLLYAFVDELKGKYARQGNCKLRSLKAYLPQLWLPNGTIDIFGLFANGYVISLSLIPIFLPPLALWLKMDPLYLAVGHRSLIPLARLSFPEKILFHLARLLVELFCAVKTCNCFRMVGLLGIIFFRDLELCYNELKYQPVSDVTIRDLKQLHLLYPIIREVKLFLFPVFLALIYILILVCVTVTMLISTNQHIPAELYLIIILTLVVGVTSVGIFLHLAVSIDVKSSSLHNVWLNSCSEIEVPPYRRRMHKTLRSIKPIRIQYGSFGSFKKATRTDYLNSLLLHCLNCILTVKS